MAADWGYATLLTVFLSSRIATSIYNTFINTSYIYR